MTHTNHKNLVNNHFGFLKKQRFNACQKHKQKQKNRMIDGSQSDTASAAMNDTPAMTTQAKDPTIYNYLNTGGYVFNTILTFFGPAIFNLPTNSELSERYATLVTPSWWTFSIWLIIFLFQGIFVVVQMMEEYRHLPIIQEGIYRTFFMCIFFTFCEIASDTHNLQHAHVGHDFLMMLFKTQNRLVLCRMRSSRYLDSCIL